MAYGDFLDLSEWAARNARFDTSNTADMVLAKSAINSAYLASCDTGDPWQFLQQEGAWLTTAGGDVYDFDSIATSMGVTGGDIADILNLVSDTTGRPIKSTSWEALEGYSWSTQDDAENEPVFWARWERRIRLWPTPQTEYTVGCFSLLTPSVMTADADEPLVPTAWRHRLLVPYASAILLRTEGGLEAASEAQRHQDEWEKAFMQFRAAYGTAGKPTFNPTTPGWDARDPTQEFWSGY